MVQASKSRKRIESINRSARSGHFARRGMAFRNMCLHSFGFPKERKDIFVTLTSGRRSQVFLVDSTDCIEMFNETSVRSIGKPFRMDLEKSSTVPSISLQRNPRLRYTRPKNTNFNCDEANSWQALHCTRAPPKAVATMCAV